MLYYSGGDEGRALGRRAARAAGWKLLQESRTDEDSLLTPATGRNGLGSGLGRVYGLLCIAWGKVELWGGSWAFGLGSSLIWGPLGDEVCEDLLWRCLQGCCGLLQVCVNGAPGGRRRGPGPASGWRRAVGAAGDLAVELEAEL